MCIYIPVTKQYEERGDGGANSGGIHDRTGGSVYPNHNIVTGIPYQDTRKKGEQKWKRKS